MTDQKRRITRLERVTGDKGNYHLFVDWGDGQAPKLKPGTKVKVLTWGPDDTISETVRIIGADGK